MKKSKIIYVLLIGLTFSSFNKTSIINSYKANSFLANTNDSFTPRMVTTTFNGDSKHEIGITWHLDSPSLNQYALLVEDSIGDFDNENAIKLSIGKGITLESKIGSDDPGKVYKAKFNGLKENTKYIYKVGNESNYSDIHSFTTSGNNESFNFVHASDPQGWSIGDYVPGFDDTLKNIKTKFPSFIALTGDIVDRAKEGKLSNAYNQWLWALDNTKENLKDLIIAPVSGNHETGSYQFSSRFNLEKNENDPGISGNYYSFSYNDAHFLCLNTNDTLNPNSEEATGLSDDQLKFINNDLENNKNYKWKFVLMHKGLFDAGEHSSNKQYEEGTYHDYDIAKIREQLVPIFDKYKIDVVLQGHDHLYSRTYPTKVINNSYVVGNYKEITKTYENHEYLMKIIDDGTIYANTSTASGSKYYSVADYDESMMHFEVAEGMTPRMYTNYRIDGDNLYVDSYKINSKGEESLYESWGITKDEIEEEKEIINPEKGLNYKGLTIGLSVGSSVLVIALIILIVVLIKKRGQK